MSDTDTDPSAQPPVRPQPPSTFGDYLTRPLGLLARSAAALSPQTPQPQPNPLVQPVAQPQPQPPVAQPGPQPPAQPQPPQPSATEVATSGFPRGLQVDPSADDPHGPWERRPQPSGRQAFVRNRPTERVSDLGGDHKPIELSKYLPGIWDSSQLPNPREAYPVIHGSGRLLADSSAPAVSGPARVASSIAGMFGPLLDLVGGGNFSPAFGKSYGTLMKGRADQMRMNREHYELERERMLDHAEDAYKKHKLMMSQYRDILSTYKLGGFSQNPGENQQIATELLKQLNQLHSHQKLDDVLDNAGIGAVEKKLLQEDAERRDFESGAESLRSSDRRRTQRENGGQEETDFDKRFSSDADHGGELPTKGPGAPGGEGPTAPSRRDPSETLPQSPQEAAAKIGKDQHLSEEGVDAAISIAETGKYEGMTPGQLGSKRNAQKTIDNILSGANQYRSLLNRAAKTGATPEERLQNLANISPSYAARIQGFGDYGEDVMKLPLSNKERDKYIELTQAVYPNYQPKNFKIAEDFTKDNAESRNIVRFSGLSQNGLNILKELKGRDENASIPINQIKAWLANRVTGDSTNSNLARQLYDWNVTSNSIQTLSGTPRVTLVKMMDEHGGATLSPRQLRGMLQQDMADAWSHVVPYQLKWEGIGKKSILPGMSETSWHTVSSFLRMNPNTGQIPQDPNTPPELLSLSKDPSKSSRRLSDDEKLPPLSIKDIREARKRLEGRKNLPADDPISQKLRESIGHVLDPPWNRDY